MHDSVVSLRIPDEEVPPSPLPALEKWEVTLLARINATLAADAMRKSRDLDYSASCNRGEEKDKRLRRARASAGHSVAFAERARKWRAATAAV